MGGSDLLLAIVEVSRHASPDIGGESGKPHRLRVGVDAIKVDQARQRLLQRRDVVITHHFWTIGRGIDWRKRPRRKEARRALYHGRKRADLVGPETRVTVAVPRQFGKPRYIGNPKRRLGDGFP